jgi:GH24 family phage-related lysozyme (muramidase)
MGHKIVSYSVLWVANSQTLRTTDVDKGLLRLQMCCQKINKLVPFYQMKKSGFTVNSLTYPKKLTQNQFDALCSFLIAIGIENFTSSTLLKKLRIDPNDPDIRTEFRRWKYHREKAQEGEERKHVVCEEFVKRREEELQLYFKEDSRPSSD